MRYKDKREARAVNDPGLTRPKGVSDEQWRRALDLYEAARIKGDKFPELTVAQAALETGWFKHMSGNYNFFGQKAGKSQQGSVKVTKEYDNNKEMTTIAKFRDYDSLNNAIDDRLKKWGNKYKNAKTVDDAIKSIWQYDPKTGMGKGYATDINYDNKLKKILGMMGVPPNQVVSEDRFEKRRSLTPTPEMARDLVEGQVKIDNTAVQNKVQDEIIQPLVTNNVEAVTEGSPAVEQARNKIDEEQNKFEFVQTLLQASRVEFIEDTPNKEFKMGGKVKSNREKFLEELARINK